MALTVNTNTSSISSLNNLNRTQRALSSTFERISSGRRINRAADDAAGLAVSENLDALGRSLDAAKRNANDGVSVVQTAEGATSEVGSILKRMRELAVQAGSETLDTAERAFIQEEVDSLVGEIDRIAAVTQFNGVSLTDGSSASLDVQVGANDTANDRISITLGDLRSATLTVNALDVDDAANAQASITTIDAAIDSVNTHRSSYGAVQNRLSSAVNSLDVYAENIMSAKSRITDADFAKEAAELAKQQIMQQAGMAVLGQSNQMNQGVLRLLG